MKESTVDTTERAVAVIGAAVGVIEPVTGVFATMIKEFGGKFLKGRLGEAEDILMTEIRHADAWDRLNADSESTAARTFRYVRATTVGLAHENLRILARLVIHGDGSRAIPPDDFLYFAQTIESLRHDELVVLAAFLRAQEMLDGPNVMSSARSLWDGVQKQLTHFDEVQLLGLASALLRTGFLATVQRGAAGTSWMVTQDLRRLQTTTQFMEALAEADAKK